MIEPQEDSRRQDNARFLVHIHVFYPKFWPELRDALSALAPYTWDLWITMVENHEEISAEALKLKPDAHIQIIPNRGYDVAPFLHVLEQVDLSQYDFCIKWHTKQNYVREDTVYEYHSLRMPYKRSGSAWRQALLAPFLGKNFPKCLTAFHRDARLGMVSDHRFIMQKGIEVERVAIRGAHDLLSRMGLETQQLRWVSGTMFICRAELLEPVKKLHLTAEDFPIPDKGHTISFPHMVEVALGGLTVAQGYQVRDVFTPVWQRMWRRLAAYAQIVFHTYIFRVKRTRSGRLLVKLFRIPVFSMKLKKD